MIELVEKKVLEKLKSISKEVKVRTIDFVNEVIRELKKEIEIDSEREVEIRPLIVDILWQYRKRGLVKFDDSLLTFEKIGDL